MAKFIADNSISIMMFIIILVCVIIMVVRMRKGLLIKAALYAVSKAEETWGSNTGKIKFAEVYTYITKQYPIITFFFTEKQLSDIIEDALSKMKQILATKESKLQEKKIEEENAEKIQMQAAVEQIKPIETNDVPAGMSTGALEEKKIE